MKIIPNKAHYVRNMTDAILFTLIGLKDAEHIGTALRKVQLSYGKFTPGSNENEKNREHAHA